MILKQDRRLDFAAVKDAARGRWRELLPDLLGWHPETCDGKNRPCPRCGGKDRFRFTDYGGDGSALCNQCAPIGIGDGIDVLAEFGDVSKAEACTLAMRRLGLEAARRSEPAIRLRTSDSAKRPGPTDEEKAGVRAEASGAVAKFQAQLTDERLNALARDTGVPTRAWAQLGVGYADGDDLPWYRVNGDDDWREADPAEAWTIPEHSGRGEIIGFSARARGGRKGSPRKGTRGLALPSGWRSWSSSDEKIYAPEGASDTAALLAMGRLAVGRPSKNAGVELIAEMVQELGIAAGRLFIVGENDRTTKGWPGREGAIQTAEKLSRLLGRIVRWTLPPEGFKDARAFYLDRVRREAEG